LVLDGVDNTLRSPVNSGWDLSQSIGLDGSDVLRWGLRDLNTSVLAGEFLEGQIGEQVQGSLESAGSLVVVHDGEVVLEEDTSSEVQFLRRSVGLGVGLHPGLESLFNVSGDLLEGGVLLHLV